MVQRRRGKIVIRLLQLLGLCEPFSLLERDGGGAISGLVKALCRSPTSIPRDGPSVFRFKRLSYSLRSFLYISMGSAYPTGSVIFAKAVAVRSRHTAPYRPEQSGIPLD